MELHLTGRTVLVTGASKGIGLGIAQCFAQEGCHLRLVARSGDLLVREADAIRTSCGVDVQTLALDLSTEASRQRLTDSWPDIDVLVNNAGDIPGGSIGDVSTGGALFASYNGGTSWIQVQRMAVARLSSVTETGLPRLYMGRTTDLRMD